MSVLQTTNLRIINFYKKYPQLDFESINLIVVDVLDKCTNGIIVEESIVNNPIYDLHNSVSDILQTYISSSEERIQQNIVNLKELINKNAITPIISPPIIPIHTLLNRLYPTSEVVRVPIPNTHNNAMSNLYMMNRDNCQKILIENHAMEHNIELEHIDKFIRHIEHYNCHGIFLSQHSGISSKPNYHIQCYNEFIVVFIHYVEYSPEKIKVAIDIIDNLSVKFNYYGLNKDGYNIDKDILEEINKEYQYFVSQKEAIITVLREGQRKIISHIEGFKFPSLDKYLSLKFIMPFHKENFKCDICKEYNANNLKALAAHKRGCKRKKCKTPIPSNVVIS